MRGTVTVFLALCGAALALAQDDETPATPKRRWSAERRVRPSQQAWERVWRACHRGTVINGLDKLVRLQTPAYLGVGVWPKEEPAKEKDGKKHVVGLEVTRLDPTSPAGKAGIKKGDLITKIEGEQVPRKSPRAWFAARVRGRKVGDPLKFTLRRTGDDGVEKEMEVTPVLAAYPPSCEPRAHDEFKTGGVEGMSTLEETLHEKKLMDAYADNASNIGRVTMLPIAPIRVGGVLHPNPHLLSEVVYLLRNAHAAPLFSQRLMDRVSEVYSANRQSLGDLLAIAADCLDVKVEQAERVRNTEFTLADFIAMLKGVSERAKKAASGLSAEERRAFLKTALAVVLREGEIDDEVYGKMFAASLKVDYAGLFGAAHELARHLVPETLRAVLKDARAQAPPENEVPGVSGGVLYYEPNSPIGPVVVGGDGDNVYTGAFALILDAGGDDVYIGSHATATIARPVSVVVDFKGDDRYVFGKTGGACAIGGVSVLLDVRGDDAYVGGSATQAAAVCGVSILADFAGHDTYSAGSFCQGAAFFGVALLLDAQTRKPEDPKHLNFSCDRYSARRYAQGVGLPRGFGALLDAGGNDVYITGGVHKDFRDPERACLSLSQGFGYGLRPWQTHFGAAGGFGVLADFAGHDTYIGDYFCQGSSYWFAYGCLYDAAGDDTYVCGRYSQGAGIHISVGVLLDLAGDDRYSAYEGVAQGCGHDLAVGFLLDLAGNDAYTGGWLCQGAGNDAAYGFLLDAEGDDTYHTTRPGRAQPTGNFSKGHQRVSFGMLVDLAGKDTYSAPGRADGKTLVIGGDEKRKSVRWGVLIDRSDK